MLLLESSRSLHLQSPQQRAVTRGERASGSAARHASEYSTAVWFWYAEVALAFGGRRRRRRHLCAARGGHRARSVQAARRSCAGDRRRCCFFSSRRRRAVLRLPCPLRVLRASGAPVQQHGCSISRRPTVCTRASRKRLVVAAAAIETEAERSDQSGRHATAGRCDRFASIRFASDWNTKQHRTVLCTCFNFELSWRVRFVSSCGAGCRAERRRARFCPGARARLVTPIASANYQNSRDRSVEPTPNQKVPCDRSAGRRAAAARIRILQWRSCADVLMWSSRPRAAPSCCTRREVHVRLLLELCTLDCTVSVESTSARCTCNTVLPPHTRLFARALCT